MNPQSDKPHSAARAEFILVFLLIASLIFGAWSFSKSQSYKNGTSGQVASAVAAARAAEDAKITQQFNDQIQKPYKTYSGPVILGGITFSYPKSYSAYIDETNPGEPLNAYFYPNVVPGLSTNTDWALRVELMPTEYAGILNQYTGSIQNGSLKATTYQPPKMIGVKNFQPGTRLDGIVGQDQNGGDQTGTIVILPVRDKTLKIYTQSPDFLDDFNNVVLANLSYLP